MNNKPELQRVNTLNQISIDMTTKPRAQLNYSTSMGASQDSYHLSSSLPIGTTKPFFEDQIIEYPFSKVSTSQKIDYPTSADDQTLPTQIFCAHCSRAVLTRVEKQYGVGALVVTCLILLLFWPLFWIPCVVSECRDIIHYCPQCSEVVGQKPYKLCC